MIMIQENRAQKGCFAKSQTPQDVFWNPIIGQFLYGTVYEEDDLINELRNGTYLQIQVTIPTFSSNNDLCTCNVIKAQASFFSKPYFHFIFLDPKKAGEVNEGI